MALHSSTSPRATLLAPFVTCSLLAGVVLYGWQRDGLVYLLAGIQVLYALLAWVRLKGRFDVEQADSLYFLGFLLTVSLLAASFLRATGGGRETLQATLVVVGQGLVLTVLGLFLRQAAVLGSAGEESSGSHGVTTLDPRVRGDDGQATVDPRFREDDRVTARNDNMNVAANEVRDAADRLKAAAERINTAQDAIVDVVTRLRDSSALLQSEIAEATRHISGGAHDAAAAIVQAASDVKIQLENGVAGFRHGASAAVNELNHQGQAILEAAENHGRLASQMLTQLERAAESASNTANSAMAATESGAKALAERARNLPDVSEPARKYADSLSAAGTAIESAQRVVIENAGAVAESLQMFKQLEEEYVTLVQDLMARERDEAIR